VIYVFYPLQVEKRVLACASQYWAWVAHILRASKSRKLSPYDWFLRTITTTLPSDFISSKEDCSVDDVASKQLEQEYKIDNDSCIESMIYFGMTQWDIV
jgi:hypothetical protein